MIGRDEKGYGKVKNPPCTLQRLLYLHPDAADLTLVVGGIDGVNRIVIVDKLMTDGILVVWK